jgi:D-alanyl-D-alanine dipeptidase
MFIRTSLVLIVLMLPARALADPALPKGFVYLREVDPTIVQDIRYAGSHNFVGRPISGYRAAECVLSASAANALAAVQRRLAENRLSLIVWIAIGRSGRCRIFCNGAKIQLTPK